MSKQLKLKRLQEIRFQGFRKGLLPSVNPNAGVDGLVRSKNLYNFSLPEKLITRPSYELKYETPIGMYSDLLNEEVISFDNYFDRNNEGAEVTIYVTKAITTSQYTDLTLPTIQIYARPYYNGAYWKDKWENLTKIHITKINSISTTTGGIKLITLDGNYGNLAQWRIINYSIDRKRPCSVIKSYDEGTNTVFIISDQQYLNDWNINDNIVLMRDYIPITTHAANYETNAQQIDFVRGTNKMIIGFGGDKGKRALVIERVKSYFYINLDIFNEVLNSVDKLSFKQTNRIVIDQIVTDYTVLDAIGSTITGTLPSGDYSGKFVLAFDGYELQENYEKKITLTNNLNAVWTPLLDIGKVNRRLKHIEVYFNYDLLNHYKANKWDVSGDDPNKEIWLLQPNGQAIIITVPDNLFFPNIHDEDCATSLSNSNNAGSWQQYSKTINNYTTADVFLDGSDYYVRGTVEQILITNPYNSTGINAGSLRYPINALSRYPSGEYNLSFRITYHHPTGNPSWNYYMELSIIKTNGSKIAISTISVINNTWTDYDIDFDFGNETDWEFIQISVYESNFPATTGYIKIDRMQINEISNAIITADPNQYGEEIYTRLGYIGELVKDFGVSHVRNNFIYCSQAYINEKYRTTVFRNAINSDGANMQTIIPAETAIEIESVFGQNIIGIASVPNSNLIIFTESTITILDPESSVSIERFVGSGLKTKQSMVALKGSIYYCSDNDIMKISPNTGYIPQPISAFTLRKQYEKIKRKDLITACFDRFVAYRLSLPIDENTTEEDFKELIFVDEFGFSEAERTHHPVKLINGMFGFVWFLADDNNIYSEPFNLEEIIGYADVYGDYRSGW